MQHSVKNADWQADLQALRERGLSPSLNLVELMDDLRNGQGFALLFKDVVRTLGLESARILLKRHGFLLGRNAATQAPVHASHDALVDGFLGQLGAFLPLCKPVGHAMPYNLEWVCTLGLADVHGHEVLINQENGLLWVLTGFAAGYLHQILGHHYHISYARRYLRGEVHYDFFARLSSELQDVDPDLPIPHTMGGMPGPAPEADDHREALANTLLSPESAVGALIRQVAPTDATVLLMGDSGVGKSLVARQLHAMSARAHKPWVEINCAALPEQLIESELFGVERGAYSGATLSRKGKFEQAHGGSLFLDEVGLLSPGAQSKLLRVLQSGNFEKLGSNLTIHCDVRVIAATNEHLEALVQEGKFREDLFYRLNVFPVTIPSLLERRNDVPLIASAVLKKLAKKYGKNIARCSTPARQILLSYDWPGNIRELENVLERAVILCPDGTEIQPMHLGLGDSAAAVARRNAAHGGAANADPLPEPPINARWQAAFSNVDAVAEELLKHQLGSIPQLNDALVRAAVRVCAGNLNSAAQALGMTRAQLSYQLKKRAPTGR